MSAPGPEPTSLLASLLKSLVLIGSAAAGSAVQRTASTIMAHLFVAGLFGISLGFLTFSGHAALTAAIGSILASLIVGGAYLFAGLVAMLFVQSRYR